MHTKIWVDTNPHPPPKKRKKTSFKFFLVWVCGCASRGVPCILPVRPCTLIYKNILITSQNLNLTFTITLYLKIYFHICTFASWFAKNLHLLFSVHFVLVKIWFEFYGDKVRGKVTTPAPLLSFSSCSSLSFTLYLIFHLDISLFLRH